MSPASWNLTQICMTSDDENRQLRCSRSHNVQISLLANETGFGAASSNTEIENDVSSLYMVGFWQGCRLVIIAFGLILMFMSAGDALRRQCSSTA